MTTKNFFFDKKNSFCISLQSNKARCDNMHRRFSLMSMQVTTFQACTELDKTLDFASYLNIGQKLCSQSHIKLWKHILNSNVPYALVLEDDAVFDHSWEDRLQEFDVCKIQEFDAIFLNASEPEADIFKWVKANEQYLTAGYIISRQGIFALLELFKCEYHASDFMMVQLQKRSKSYTYFPWLILQDGVDSTIGSGVQEDHAKVIKCLSEINYSLENYIF